MDSCREINEGKFQRVSREKSEDDCDHQHMHVRDCQSLGKGNLRWLPVIVLGTIIRSDGLHILLLTLLQNVILPNKLGQEGLAPVVWTCEIIIQGQIIFFFYKTLLEVIFKKHQTDFG